MTDRWSAGGAYEDFMGRWSRPLARAFVAWLGVGPRAHWLDVGTGTGALASAICDAADPASVVACDPAEPFIEAARAGSSDPRVSFIVAGAGDIPVRDGGFDAIASCLALNFFPDPGAGIIEQRDGVRAGGLVAACVWDYAGGMEFLRRFWDAASAIAPDDAAALDEGARFPICDPDRLRTLFDEAGLTDVRVAPLDVPTVFGDFDDFWRPLLGGTGPAPTFVATLSASQRAALRADLEGRMPPEPDGRIMLSARAWAVAGIRA